jgi:uncharacterized protein YcfJ
MQKKIIATAILVAVSIQSRADDFMDTAKVISSRPIYQTVTGQECYNVPVRTQSSGNRSMGGSILGGIAGALLGSQVGQGSGRVAAGAAGAIAGAITGDRIQNDGSNSGSEGIQQECKDVSKQVVSGYEVHYLYGGHEGVTTMPQQPGNTITVGVTAH